MPTEAQRAVLRYLLEHPGEDVFDYYEARGRPTWGMERLSRRGAAGRMAYALADAGLVELGPRRFPVVTSAGEEAADRG